MAASSSRSWRYHVFPSFSGEIRKSFISYLLKELERKPIITFIDHGIERSRPIGPELLLAIRESMISIVVFSNNYASSTWCLNELAEIHDCSKKSDQMVIPVFYNVDPSDVRKQTGEFGNVFQETCKGKPEDQKQRWRQALEVVANMAGYDLQKWPDEAAMVEKIANDVSNKITTPSNGFGDFVGIEAHLEAINSMLCLESEEVRMVGIWGASGIGKSTIAGALFSQLSSQFHRSAFVSYKRTIGNDDYEVKLSWEQQFLSKILDQKDMKINYIGEVQKRLKHTKVLIGLDDVDDRELLKTLVGQTGWFGSGSRIIVITQDRHLLKAHKIDLVYEVELPSKDLALQMLCHSAFGKIYPPDGFMELATEVVTLAGNLPLGLSVIGSALKGKDKEEWINNLPTLQDDLDGKIEKTLTVSYDRLDRKIQDIFLHIAWLFNGFEVKYIKDMLGDSDNIGLTMLADKSLIRITPEETVEMHNLLQKLGREIARTGKRRFLDDFEDIRSVLIEHSGTETVVGINLKYSTDLNQPYFIDENSFEGMRNLQFLILYDYTWLRRQVGPQGLTYLPRKLRLLNWNKCPLKCLPSNFNAEYLVELTMHFSKLEKLWEGTPSLGSLKKMDMSYSSYLKEIADLSKAINLEEVILIGCWSLVTLPSSIQYVINLRRLDMGGCTKLESFPTHLINLGSLEYLNLINCSRLANFPEMVYRPCSPRHYSIKVEDCFWNKNHPGHDYLDSLMRCIPGKLRPEYLTSLKVRGNMLKKLWKGIQSLGSLVEMDLSECENLTEIPDLSKATNLERLALNGCKSLVTLPSTIGNLQKLMKLEMGKCTGLEVLPNDVNLSSLSTLNLGGCSRLTSFPQISTSIEYLYLDDTAIEQVPCCIVNFSKLSELTMCGCKRLKNISPNIFRMSLEKVDFSECVELVTALSGDASVVATMSMEDHLSFITLSIPKVSLFRLKTALTTVETEEMEEYFHIYNCLKLDLDARELILRSYLRPTVLPGGEVPMYFTHRASGDSLTVPVPQISLSQVFLRFQACVVLEPLNNLDDFILPDLRVCLHLKEVNYWGKIFVGKPALCKTDHLVLSSFKFPSIGSGEFNNRRLADLDVKVQFFCKERIKECGVRLLSVFPSPDDAARCSENQQSVEKCDVVVEIGRSKLMQTTLGTYEESYILPCGQIVADTALGDYFGGFVGIEAHLEVLNSMLCLESEETRMVGILGTSGIGKTTIARALFSQHSSKFHYHAFITCKRTIRNDYRMKLYWEKQFLSEILGLHLKDLKIEHLGMVERRFKHKKVLIVLDDVDDLELLKTLVGQTGWFGSGSRIIVITQDRHLLKAHKIDLVYEVELPSKALALRMFCRSAFDQDSPLDGFMELSVRMVEIAGNLPLGLSVLGSSLNGREKKEWMEMLPGFQTYYLNENIEKTLGLFVSPRLRQWRRQRRRQHCRRSLFVSSPQLPYLAAAAAVGFVFVLLTLRKNVI